VIGIVLPFTLSLFNVSNPITVFGTLIFILILLYFVIRLSFGILPRRATAALKRGDYAAAMKLLNILKYFVVNPINAANLTHFEGAIHMAAGRLAEAEPLLLESRDVALLEIKGWGKRKKQLAHAQKVTHYAALSNLGSLYMYQERYQEAIWAQDAAIEVQPERSLPYLGLAEVYLEQGGQAERALLLLDKALEKEQANPKESLLPIIHAGRAWALAQMGQHKAADAALAQAWQAGDPAHKPRFAGLHITAGQTRLAQGQREQAIEHFQRAQELDPQSWNSQQAARELAKLDAAPDASAGEAAAQ
jgi:tetratricopeptide (TPR) repeat protein